MHSTEEMIQKLKSTEWKGYLLRIWCSINDNKLLKMYVNNLMFIHKKRFRAVAKKLEKTTMTRTVHHQIPMTMDQLQWWIQWWWCKWWVKWIHKWCKWCSKWYCIFYIVFCYLNFRVVVVVMPWEILWCQWWKIWCLTNRQYQLQIWPLHHQVARDVRSK